MSIWIDGIWYEVETEAELLSLCAEFAAREAA